MRIVVFVVAALLWICPMMGARQAEGECVVIYDEARDTVWRSDPGRCASRLSPASTFKVPHALIALETGVITAETIETWDGTKYQNRASWEKPHSLESAIRNSVLWFFQRTATRIGPERMRGFLERFAYGNADTSGVPNAFWINGTLRISADEQVAFLRRFYRQDLGIRPEHQDKVFHALLQPAGAVQNSTGVHKLASTWRPGTELSAKTGGGMALIDPELRVSWLVGRVTLGGQHYVFASNIVRRGTLDPVDAARLAFRTFRQRKLID
jgi:beta-lactamase class D